MSERVIVAGGSGVRAAGSRADERLVFDGPPSGPSDELLACRLGTAGADRP